MIFLNFCDRLYVLKITLICNICVEITLWKNCVPKKMSSLLFVCCPHEICAQIDKIPSQFTMSTHTKHLTLPISYLLVYVIHLLHVQKNNEYCSVEGPWTFVAYIVGLGCWLMVFRLSAVKTHKHINLLMRVVVYWVQYEYNQAHIVQFIYTSTFLFVTYTIVFYVGKRYVGFIHCKYEL